MCVGLTPTPAPIGFTPGPTQRGKIFYKKVGVTNVWRTVIPSAFLYVAGMEIDVDGAPNAYGPPEKPGLDFLGNASSNYKDWKQGEWRGIVAGPNGTGPSDVKGDKAFVQKDGIHKGFFVSQTSLHDQTVKDLLDPARYVDATKVPYLALPLARPPKKSKHGVTYFEELGLRLGDYGFAVNSANGRSSSAIFADSKHLPKLGECSAALADALGVPADPKGGYKRKHGDKSAIAAGASSGIIYLVFPSSGAGQGRIPSLQEIQGKGKELFDNWGGMERLIDCFPEWLGICHYAARHKRKKA
jgi:hypothetical protein